SGRTSSKVEPPRKKADDIFDDIYFGKLFELEGRFITKIPPIIYHYTSLSSFLQILQAKKPWASRSEFLNDATEFRYDQQIVSEQIDALEKHNSKYKLFCYKLRQALEGEPDAPFISCFCQDGDLLSQWRGYSSHGQGICIGFHSEKLQRLKKVTLCNVIYEPTQQINFMFSHLKLLADSLLAAGFDF